MRKLDRAIATPPACLGRFAHGLNTWSDVNGADKAEIRASLEQMQGRRCAYCEGDIGTSGHVEHFRRKRDFSHLTFDWNNLYWSCDQTDSCGHYKDHGAGPYRVRDLLEPCVDDPDRFFRFRSDGSISIRSGLGEADHRRAEETLRVFNLNPRWGRLRNMRHAAVTGYIKDADEAASAGFTGAEIRAYFEDALESAKQFPFYTAIRHVLTEP